MPSYYNEWLSAIEELQRWKDGDPEPRLAEYSESFINYKTGIVNRELLSRALLCRCTERDDTTHLSTQTCLRMLDDYKPWWME